MYDRRRTWVGIIGLILVLLLIVWLIIHVTNSPGDNGTQSVSISQGKKSGQPSKHQSKSSTGKSSEHSAKSGVNKPKANKPSKPSGDTKTLTNTGSGEVFFYSIIVMILAAAGHRLRATQLKKV
jgi:hypothetical protein